MHIYEKVRTYSLPRGHTRAHLCQHAWWHQRGHARPLPLDRRSNQMSGLSMVLIDWHSNRVMNPVRCFSWRSFPRCLAWILKTLRVVIEHLSGKMTSFIASSSPATLIPFHTQTNKHTHTHRQSLPPLSSSVPLSQFSAFNFLMDHFDNIVAPHSSFSLLPILLLTSGQEFPGTNAVDLRLVTH